MKRVIAKYVSKCLVCQQIKAKYQRPAGLLKPLKILKWKWKHITMDFVVWLPRSRRSNDTIWVIVDRLTKSAHFLSIVNTASMDALANLDKEHIVRYHGVLMSVVSDRDP